MGMKALSCGHCDLGLLRIVSDAELGIGECQVHVDDLSCLSSYVSELVFLSEHLSGVIQKRVSSESGSPQCHPGEFFFATVVCRLLIWDLKGTTSSFL